MATTEGPTEEGPPTDKGQPPPPPSPLSGAYLLIIVGEPYSDAHKEDILRKIANGLQSWDVDSCHVSLEKELQAIIAQAPEGEEARNGERLIQFASENLVTEVLVQPQLNTLIQCIRNLLSSFTRHRHLVHAGYTFAGNGSWIVQDGTLSLADLVDAFQETDVQRVLRAYENSVSVDIHCAPEGDWSTARLRREAFSKLCRVRVNPDDSLSPATNIQQFIDYLSPFVRPATVEQLLEPSDVVGNIRFSHPTLYVFPGGQGDAALFGINGFNMLVDGGFARKACFWDFVRHLDRLDAVLMTRLNNSNCNGLAAVLRRKRITHVYPQIGHFFCNLQERRNSITPDTDKVRDSLIINLLDEGHEIVDNLRHLQLKPHICVRDSVVEPINLYHKVGHGKLDMYVLSPSKDSRELKEFLSKWNANDPLLFSGGASTSKKSDKEFSFPIQNIVSICALLVWQPANPSDTITRILFPGSAPQNKIFEGLEKLRHLEFMKHPVCSAKTLSPSSSSLGINAKLVSSRPKSTPAVIDKLLPGESVHKAQTRSTPSVESVNRQNIAKTATIPVSGTAETKPKMTTMAPMPARPPHQPKPKVDRTKAEIIPTKTELDKNIVNEVEISKPEKPSPIIDMGKPKTDKHKQEVKHKRAEAKSLTKTPVEKKPTTKHGTALEKKSSDSVKSSPTTPKKSVESKVNGVMSRAETTKAAAKSSTKMKASPSATPAKSAKEENNRKVVESKAKTAAKPAVKLAKKEEPTKPTKTERKPKKPFTSSPSKVIAKPGSPMKTILKSAKAKKETKKIKGETEKGVVTDSSTVSTPSTVDAEMTMIKEGKIEEKITEELKKDDKIIEEEVKLKEKKLGEIEKQEEDSSKDINESVERKESLSTAEEEKFVKENGVDTEATEVKPAEGAEKEKEVSDKDEEDEILIIEKVEVEQYGEDSIQEQESIESHFPEEAEDELQKHLRDEAESEKKMKDIEGDKDEAQDKEDEEKEIIEKEDVMEKVSDVGEVEKKEVIEKKVLSDEEKEVQLAEESEKLTPESKEKLVEEVQEIITSATEYISKTKVELGGKDSSELSAEGVGSDEQKLGETKDLSSPEKLHLASDKQLAESIEDEQKQDDTKDKSKELVEKYGAEESQPDERFSTTIESGATTAPTLPEDERIPLDEIKEGIEEKHVKEDTKEKDIFAAAKPEQPTTLPQVAVVGGPFETRGHLLARDIVKTPDEVADLPVHEEVDGIYEGDEFGSREFSKTKDDLLDVAGAKKEHEIKEITKEKLKPEKDDTTDVKKEVTKDLEGKAKEDIEEKESIVEHIKTEEDELKELKMIRQKLEEADNGFQLQKSSEKIELAQDAEDVHVSKKEERATEEKEVAEEVQDLDKEKETVPESAEKLADSRESPDRNERDSYELYTDSGVEEEPVHGVLKGAEVAEHVLVTPDSTPESPLRHEDKKVPDIAKLSEEVETKIAGTQKKIDELDKYEDELIKDGTKDIDILKDKEVSHKDAIETGKEKEAEKTAGTDMKDVISEKQLSEQDKLVSKLSTEETVPIQDVTKEIKAEEKLPSEIKEVETEVSKLEEKITTEEVASKTKDDLKHGVEKEDEIKISSKLKEDEFKPEEEKPLPTTISPLPTGKEDELSIVKDKKEEKEQVLIPCPPVEIKHKEEKTEKLDITEKEEAPPTVFPSKEIKAPLVKEKDDRLDREKSPSPSAEEGKHEKEEVKEKPISPTPEKPLHVTPPHEEQKEEEEGKPIIDEKAEKGVTPTTSIKETEVKVVEEPSKKEKEKPVSQEPSILLVTDDTKPHLEEKVEQVETEKETVIPDLELKVDKAEKEEKVEILSKKESILHKDELVEKEKGKVPEPSLKEEPKPTAQEKEQEMKVDKKVELDQQEKPVSIETKQSTIEIDKTGKEIMEETLATTKDQTTTLLETKKDTKLSVSVEDLHDEFKSSEHEKSEKEKEFTLAEQTKDESMPPKDEKSKEKTIEKESLVSEPIVMEVEKDSSVSGKEEEHLPLLLKDEKEASITSIPPEDISSVDISRISKEPKDDQKSSISAVSSKDEEKHGTPSLPKKDEKERISLSLRNDTKDLVAEKEAEKSISPAPLLKDIDFTPIKAEKDERVRSVSPSPAALLEDGKPYLPDKEDIQKSVSPTPSLKDEDITSHEIREHDKEKSISPTPSLKDKEESDELEKSVSPAPLLPKEVKSDIQLEDDKIKTTATAPLDESTKPSLSETDEKEKRTSPTPLLKDEVKTEKELSTSPIPSKSVEVLDEMLKTSSPTPSLKEEEVKTMTSLKDETQKSVSPTPLVTEDKEHSLPQMDEKEKSVSPVLLLKQEDEIKVVSSEDDKKEKSISLTPHIKDDEKLTTADKGLKEDVSSTTIFKADTITKDVAKDEKEKSISPALSLESEKSSIGKDETKKSVSPTPSIVEDDLEPRDGETGNKERSISPASSVIEETKPASLQKEDKDKSVSPTQSLKDEEIKKSEPTKEKSISPTPSATDEPKSTAVLDDREKSGSPTQLLKMEEFKPCPIQKDKQEKSEGSATLSKDESKSLKKDYKDKSYTEESKPDVAEKGDKEKSVSPTVSLQDESKYHEKETIEKEKSVSPTPSFKHDEKETTVTSKYDDGVSICPTPSTTDERKPSVQGIKDDQQLSVEKDEEKIKKSLSKEDSEPQKPEKEVKDIILQEDVVKEDTRERKLEDTTSKEKSEAFTTSLFTSIGQDKPAVSDSLTDTSMEQTLTLVSEEIEYMVKKDDKTAIHVKDVTTAEKDVSEVKSAKEIETQESSVTAKLEKDTTETALETTTDMKERPKGDVTDSMSVSKQEVDTPKSESLKPSDTSEQKDLSDKDETATFKSVSPAPSSEDSLEKFEPIVTEESKLTGTMQSVSPDQLQDLEKTQSPHSISPPINEKDATKMFLSMETVQSLADKDTTDVTSKEIDTKHMSMEKTDLLQSTAPSEMGKDHKIKLEQGAISIPQDQHVSTDRSEDTQKLSTSFPSDKEDESKPVSSEVSESLKSLSPIPSRKDSDVKVMSDKTEIIKCTSPLPSERTSDIKMPLSDKDGSQIPSAKDSELKPQPSERDDSLTSITSLPSEKDSDMKSVLSEKSDSSKSESQKDSEVKIEPSDKTFSPKSISPVPFEKDADLKTIASGKLSPAVSVLSDKKSETDTTASVKDDKHTEISAVAIDKSESPKSVSPVLSDKSGETKLSTAVLDKDDSTPKSVSPVASRKDSDLKAPLSADKGDTPDSTPKSVSPVPSRKDSDSKAPFSADTGDTPDSTPKSVSPVPSRKDSDSKAPLSADKGDTPKSISPVPFDKETQIKTIASDKEDLPKSVSPVPLREDEHVVKLESADTSKSDTSKLSEKDTDLKHDKEKESQKPISPVPSEKVTEIKEILSDKVPSKSVSPVPSEKEIEIKSSVVSKDDTPKSVSPVPSVKDSDKKSSVSSDKDDTPKSASPAPSYIKETEFQPILPDKDEKQKSDSPVALRKDSDIKRPSLDKGDTPKSISPVPSDKDSELQPTIKDGTPKSISPAPSDKDSELQPTIEEGTPKSASPAPSDKDSELQPTTKDGTPKTASPAPSDKDSELQPTIKDGTPKSASPAPSDKDSELHQPTIKEGTPKSASPAPSDKDSEIQPTIKDETLKSASPAASRKDISSTELSEDMTLKKSSKSDESKDILASTMETTLSKSPEDTKQKTEELLHGHIDQKISESASKYVSESKEIKSSTEMSKDVKEITKEFLTQETKTTEESKDKTSVDEKPLYATSKLVTSAADSKIVDVSKVFTESESTEITKQIVEKSETSHATDTLHSHSIKTEKTEETTIQKKESESSSVEETSSIRRMVVTASSEDGGLETELCSGDNITFMTTKPEDQSQSDKDISEASVSSTISFSATSDKSSVLDGMKVNEHKMVTTTKTDTVAKDSTLSTTDTDKERHSDEVSKSSKTQEQIVTSTDSDTIYSSADPVASTKTTVQTIVTTKTYGKDGTESITTTVKETSETGDVKYSTYSTHEVPLTETESSAEEITSTSKKDENGIKSTEIKSSKVVKTSEEIPLSAVSVMKRELSETGRSATPASDVASEREFELGGPSTPHSDISSGQASRAATHVWGESSEGRPDSRHCESDDDIPCSPMSATSHVAHSPPQFDFELHRTSEESYYEDGAKINEVKMATAMTSSFYGSLPEEDPLEQLIQENKEKHAKTSEASSAMYSSMYVSKYDDDDNDQGDEYLYGNGKGKFEAMFASSSSAKSEHIDFETAMKEHRSTRGEDIAKVTNGKKETSINGKSGLNGDSRGFYKEVYTNGKHVLEEKLNGKSSYTESSELKTSLASSSSVLPAKTISGQAVYPEPSTGFGHLASSKTSDDKKSDPIEGWGKPLGLPPPPKRILNSPTSSENQFTLVWNPVEEWGIPLGLPSPAPPPPKKDSAGEIETDLTPTSNKTTPKKVAKKDMENNKTASNTISGREANNKSKRPDSPNKRNSNKDSRNVKQVAPLYMDLTYVPHHGNSHYTSVEFFKRVRARYYVFSGTEPSREVFNALLEAKQTWEDKELEVTIIPTYDTDTLGYWVAENEEILAKYKIDLSPSASRCTINLQDHETSCSAYRLEF